MVAQEQVVAQQIPVLNKFFKEGATGPAKPLEEQLEELEEQLGESLSEEGPKREDFQVLHSEHLFWLSS